VGIYVENVIRMRKMRNAYKILVGNAERQDFMEGLGFYERTTLKCVLKKWGVLRWHKTESSDEGF
jgi:hypothetical protein